MKIFLTLVGFFAAGLGALAVGDKAVTLDIELEARVFGEGLPALAPAQRADAIIRWWNRYHAEFHPGPNILSIRFLDEMIGCKEAAIPALKTAMSSPNPEVRFGASASLDALAAVALPALDEIKKGLEDSDWRVREHCTLAISCYGILARPVLPAMIANLRHESAMLKGWAVFALGRLGEFGRPAVPALVEMLRHPGTFQVGWQPKIAVEAISRILDLPFSNPEEVLDWWEKTGKDQDFRPPR